MRKLCVFLILSVGLFSCSNKDSSPAIESEFDLIEVSDTLSDSSCIVVEVKSEMEKYLDSLGLVDVSILDTSLHIDLRYSTTNNFLKTDLYEDLNKAYLQSEVALKIVKASEILFLKDSSLRLVIWDAARSVAVQQRMWDMCEVPLERRHWYVTPPATRSLHNFGAAVDVTLMNSQGEYLDMGTDFDFFGEEAYTSNEQNLVNRGLITKKACENRQLLRAVMRETGFSPIKYEWWHYNSCSRNAAKSKYPLIFGVSNKK